ncbi:hypothetical protein KKD62_02935 [Patescibacteria group bacterium]|nr:hypothetical protein [Patescibacteria group bacterium]MBU1931824.1 hypothetical protein [Patescibacteria group bacterium]
MITGFLFWEKGALLYGESRRFVPNEMVIELTDRPQQYHQTFHPDDLAVPSFSLGWQTDEAKNQYTLMVHLTKEIWQGDIEQLSRQIDVQVMSGILYVTKNQGELGSAGAGQTQEDIEILKQVSLLEKRLFKVSKKQSWWSILDNKVYADPDPGAEASCVASGGSYEVVACSGDVTCGSFREVCECTEDNTACSTSGARCGPFRTGTCECNPTGCIGSQSVSCGGSRCNASCDECQVADNCDDVWACVADSTPASCSGVCCATDECIDSREDNGACAAQSSATASCCGSCDSGDGGTIEGGDYGKFAIWYYYDANGNGEWDDDESRLDTNVSDNIEVTLVVLEYRQYSYIGRDWICGSDHPSGWSYAYATCDNRNDNSYVCPGDTCCSVSCCPFLSNGHWVASGCKTNCYGQLDPTPPNFKCSGNLSSGVDASGNPDLGQAPDIGASSANVRFYFNLPDGWETTRIRWNTSYSRTTPSQTRVSGFEPAYISTDLRAFANPAYQFTIATRAIAVGVTEDVNPPQVIWVNSESICAGDNNQNFSTQYSDADGAADIDMAQLNIVDSSVIGNRADWDNDYWYTRAAVDLTTSPYHFKFFGRDEEGAAADRANAVWNSGQNRWELSRSLTTTGARATLNANNTWFRLSGDNLIINWNINFDNDYYLGTHNLVLWVIDSDFLEDERSLGLIELLHPIWNPPLDGFYDFHDMGNLTIQSCVANVAGTVYDASIYSDISSACFALECAGGDCLNSIGLAGAPNVRITCSGADCGTSDNPQISASNGSYGFSALPLADYTFIASEGSSGYSEVAFCSNYSQSTGNIPLDTSGATVTEDLVAFQGASESWWQAEIGDVHANGAGIRSEIPATCGDGSFEYCHPYILRNSDDSPPQQGLVTYSDGTVNYGGGDGEAESEWVANSSYNGGQRGYDYFWQLARDEEFDDDWSCGGGEPDDSRSLYTCNSADVSINAEWSAFSGNTVIYIGGENDEDIDYDLEINENITLDTDGFVAFIVSGDVTIAEDVTEIEAVIIADGTITVEGNGSDDFQFHGTGSFVSWSGFSFNRNLGMNGPGGDNRGDPAELFTYDPNIIRLAPDVLKRATYSWIEVAP